MFEILPMDWNLKPMFTQKQESRAAARKPRDAASVLVVNNIHYKYKTSQASKAATPQSSKHADA